MSTNTVLIIVISLLVVLQCVSLVIIAYMMKRIIDDKPIAFKEVATPGTPPQVVTRADLKAAREYEQEQNFRKADMTKYVDLEDMAPEEGMSLLEQLGRSEK